MNPFISCLTGNSSCCSSDNGFWYYPNGKKVAQQTDVSTVLYHYDELAFEPFLAYHSLEFKAILGRQVPDQYAGDPESFPAGIYHCKIPDEYGDIQHLFLGIYAEESKSILNSRSKI